MDRPHLWAPREKNVPFDWLQLEARPNTSTSSMELLSTELDFSAESTTRGGGCPDGPSKQAFGQKIDEILSECQQLFMNFQKFPQISQ